MSMVVVSVRGGRLLLLVASEARQRVAEHRELSGIASFAGEAAVTHTCVTEAGMRQRDCRARERRFRVDANIALHWADLIEMAKAASFRPPAESGYHTPNHRGHVNAQRDYQRGSQSAKLIAEKSFAMSHEVGVRGSREWTGRS
jgi:hypothetical protein